MSYWDSLPREVQELTLRYKNYRGPNTAERRVMLRELRNRTRSLKNFCDSQRQIRPHQWRNRRYIYRRDKVWNWMAIREGWKHPHHQVCSISCNCNYYVLYSHSGHGGEIRMSDVSRKMFYVRSVAHVLKVKK